ncbi:Rrf2 family transcriptional regulator [bacterium]|nr:MAG: Rrf2 family transcriptional regulator [bacterium]
MFRLSKAAEYAARGLLHLSGNTDRDVSVEEIAKARSVPVPYLAKLFQLLARKGFVRSQRGADGGFSLARSPREITLLEIIEAVEGPIFLNDCLIHKGFCPMDEACPIHDVWKKGQEMFLGHLRGTTLEALVSAAAVKEKKPRSNLKPASGASFLRRKSSVKR